MTVGEELVDKILQLSTTEPRAFKIQMAAMIDEAIASECEGCAVVAELWTAGKSSYARASDAIRARKPLKA